MLHPCPTRHHQGTLSASGISAAFAIFSAGLEAKGETKLDKLTTSSHATCQFALMQMRLQVGLLEAFGSLWLMVQLACS